MRKFISSLIWAPIFLIFTFFSTIIFAILFSKVFPEIIKNIEADKPNVSLFEFYLKLIGAPATMTLYALVYLSPLLAIYLCVKGKLPFSMK